MKSLKYNRTLHLPWSEGRGNDDKVAKSVETLLGRPIVITEKIDGSNTCLEKDGCFARTHSGPPTHKSFDGLKALHAELQYDLMETVQYFGEWVYAKHSIEYNALPGFFLLFGIRFLENNMWGSWGDVVDYACGLHIPTVPKLWSGKVSSEKELKKITTELANQKSSCGGEREGVVVRIYENFLDKDFSKYIMKYVRKGHVALGDDHWKHKEIIKNKLIY